MSDELVAIRFNFQLKERFEIGSQERLLRMVLWALLGIVFFFLARLVQILGTIISLFNFELVPFFILLAVFAAFGGPLTGFFIGFCGTLLYDGIIGGTVVWGGIAALGFGIFGFIVGWPMVRRDFTHGRNLVKLALASFFGWALNLVILLVGALFVGQMSIVLLFLWMLLPYLSSGLITVLVFPPVVVRLCHLLWTVVLQPGYQRLRTKSIVKDNEAR